ncbi:hypothetical protein ACQY0O_007679 [Thecaphora frezii]
MTPEEYDAMTPEQRAAHDAAAKAKEDAEQAALPYKWSQELDHVEISVPVPSGTKGRDLAIELKKKKIRVGLKGKEPIVEGELAKEIKEEDSTWMIEDSSLVQIHLEKMNKNEWWPNVVTHHPKIDTTKIVPTNSKLSDLDGETRAMVEKMMVRAEHSRTSHPVATGTDLGPLLLCPFDPRGTAWISLTTAKRLSASPRPTSCSSRR